MKTCKDCGINKSLEEFAPSKKNRDGRTSYCRPCYNVRDRAYRAARRSGPPVRVRNADPPTERFRKWCPGCQQELTIADFGSNRASKDGHAAYCKPCHNAKGKETYTRLHGSTRSYHLKRRYGMSESEVDALIDAQAGVCAVCRSRPARHVDHDHMTGRVRGVLCSGCNQGLGNFRDDAASLRRAIDYLENTTWQRTQVCTGVYRLTSPRPAARRSQSSSDMQRLICSRRAGISQPG